MFPTETPQPLSAVERVMGVLGWVIALGIILSIATIVFVVNRQQRKKQSESDSDSWVPCNGHTEYCAKTVNACLSDFCSREKNIMY